MYNYPQLSCANEHRELIQEYVTRLESGEFSVAVSDQLPQVANTLGLAYDVFDPAGERVAKLTLSAELSLDWRTPEGKARLAIDIDEQLRAIR